MFEPKPKIRFRSLALLGLALGWLLLAIPALAQSTSTQASAKPSTAEPQRKAPPGFEPVAGGAATDKVDPNKLVVGAYAMFFVLMFGYVVYVARRQAEMSKEMAELAARIEKAEKK